MVSIDLETYRLPANMTSPPKPTKRPPRHRPGERFLKGPIPWSWLEKAIGLPGRALAVALILWREAGWRKNRTVRFSVRKHVSTGVTIWSARRGLRSLESARLVSILRKQGHGLEVTLLDY